MIKVFGTRNCSRCEMVKNILNKKGKTFDYFMIDEIDENEKKDILKKAKECGKLNFPIIIQDEVVVDIKEV